MSKAVTSSVALLTVLAAGCGSDVEEREEVEADSAELVSVAEAQQLLYAGNAAPSSCATGATTARVECLVKARYSSDPTARDVALSLFRETGGIAGVLPAETYDGGFRGNIALVPALPTGADRKHLVRVRDAMRDIEDFFDVLEGAASTPVAYRFREVHFQFFRSVGRTTPSAFVQGTTWRVAYNVSGSLNGSTSAVRETIFHELFHVNDWTHADWSSRVLAPIVAGIVARCGTSKACFTPYTPTDVTVGGGMYYAFQPGIPTALEYSAELATRYHDEQLARIRGRTFGKPPFKCGAPENANAWKLLADEFFGGVDYVPPCAQ